MKKSVVIVILFCLVSQLSTAQWKRVRYEVVGGLGTSQFFGDIGGYTKGENIIGFKDLILSQTRFNINGSLKYRITSDVSVRLSLTYAMFHSTDEKGSNEERGLESTTSSFETALLGEYYFIKSKNESYLSLKGRTRKFKDFMSSLDVYAFTGIGGLSYSVKGNDELKSKGMTDGGFAAVLPLGVGTRFTPFPDYIFGLELGGRYAFSDYIDGYSSQYSKSNDVYYFLTFTFTYRIRTASNGLPMFLSKRKF